ncbi:hypothetical protein [Riemerella anatipestifer]|uniref:hypothetical protein n=1 Tax=Riemerella anatipestifer TaxID=34085 RepID=UPI0023642121|nr:hypothetical protein [Riemerella anatipestifer]MDD1539431.1 hypothetical protein [Riemerella anatipestifer]
MIKKTLFPILISSMCLGQVGIGTENVHLSEALKVEASNKGVLLPKISIPDLQQAPPVANPATSLMIQEKVITIGLITNGIHYLIPKIFISYWG